MPAETYQAWLSLYAGVALLVGLTAVLATIKTLYDLRSDRRPLPFRSARDKLLALPKLWLRWQLNYLQGAPVILVSALLFAHQLGFETLGNV